MFENYAESKARQWFAHAIQNQISEARPGDTFSVTRPVNLPDKKAWEVIKELTNGFTVLKDVDDPRTWHIRIPKQKHVTRFRKGR